MWHPDWHVLLAFDTDSDGSVCTAAHPSVRVTLFPALAHCIVLSGPHFVLCVYLSLGVDPRQRNVKKSKNEASMPICQTMDPLGVKAIQGNNLLI